MQLWSYVSLKDHHCHCSLDAAFLDTLTPPRQETTCFIRIQLNNQHIKIQALHRCMSWLSVGKPMNSWESHRKVLYGPARHTLQVIDHFKASLSYNERTLQQQVYVVNKLKTNLLCLPAIKPQNLVAQIEATIPTEVCNPQKMFPNVFKGLENLCEEFTMKVKPDVLRT